MNAQKLESPPFAPQVEGDTKMMPQAFYYSPVRFLQVMLAIAWSAIAHPFSSTVIDLATGRAYQAEQQ